VVLDSRSESIQLKLTTLCACVCVGGGCHQLLDDLQFDWEGGAAEWMKNYFLVAARCDLATKKCSVSRKVRFLVHDKRLLGTLSESTVTSIRSFSTHGQLSAAQGSSTTVSRIR
jgi:hypothetical protein